MKSTNQSAWADVLPKIHRVSGLLQMMLLALTIGIPVVALSNSNYQQQVSFHEKEDTHRRRELQEKSVIIVGAGAAGLGAALTLEENGIDNIVVLEAAPEICGRARTDTTFLGFPIDKGATFIHKSFLDEINIIAGLEIPTRFVLTGQYTGYVFENTTFCGFFHDHVKPSDEKIKLGCEVVEVSHGGSRDDGLVRAACADGRTFVADHAIITVPLSVLQNNDIVFTPNLDNVLARNERDWWGGLKIFIEFEHKFYSDYFCLWTPCYDDLGENGFRDYATLAPSSQPDVPNIVVGFLTGDMAEEFSGLTDEQIKDLLLEKLAEEFSLGVEDLGYKRHILFNWSEEPYVNGVYSSWNCPLCQQGIAAVNNQVFFAGEAFALPGEEQGWVHSAFHTGIEAASLVVNPTPTSSFPTTSAISYISQCFSPRATAVVLGKGKVQMRDLAVGDRVLTPTGDFDPVYSIDHFSTEKVVDYVVIESDLFGEQPLEVSPRHMLYVSGKDDPVPAASVAVHDRVRTLDGPARVVKISTVARRGFFNPLTQSGTIVVDGIVASTYSSYSEVDSRVELFSHEIISVQDLVHMAAVPYHRFCTTISSRMCNNHDEWAFASKMLVELGAFWANQCDPVRLFVLGGYVFLFGSMNLIIFHKYIFFVFMVVLLAHKLLPQHAFYKKKIIKTI